MQYDVLGVGWGVRNEEKWAREERNHVCDTRCILEEPEELSTLALVRRSKLRRGGTKPGEAKDSRPASQMFVGVRLCATEERSSKDLPVERENNRELVTARGIRKHGSELVLLCRSW